jgi:hypothetical protein
MQVFVSRLFFLFMLLAIFPYAVQAQEQVPTPAVAPLMDDTAKAPVPPEPTSAVETMAAEAIGLKEKATRAVGGLVEKAGALRDDVLPNVPVPGLPAAMPPQLPVNDPSITQGQDRSIGVATEGKPESIFFTPNQLAAIMRAKEGYMAPREAYDPNNQASPTSAGPRTVSLAGIVYINAKNWVIWLNGERVTRKNMPQRLVGVTVRPQVVHLRWLDITNQRIVNISLKPHQQYLLDSDTIIPIPGA